MKILVGLSGGLDSTYTVKKLLDAGHSVEGAVLLFSDHTDLEKAKISASELGINLRVINCQEKFNDTVIANFITEYQNGKTPNPCAVCNRHCKIEMLYKECIENDFDAFATGHYCKISHENGRYFVQRAKDTKKDQSYMLYALTQDQLSKLITPLSDVLKSEVREESARLNYSSANDSESMDICFIPNGKYTDFLEKAGVASKKGNFVLPDGKIIAPHKGIMNYTVGQRKNLGIALGYRSFITKIDAQTGNITLDRLENCKVSGFYVNNLNFQKLFPKEIGDKCELLVKIRYAASPVKCFIEFLQNGCRVEFLESYPLPAPGQAAVFYDGDDLAFGGIIESIIYN
jgi:tRNA-specific 2-thiouridylase